MTTTIHVCLDIRGLLKRDSRYIKSAYRGVFTYKGTNLQTADEIRDFLMDQLSIGRELLPFGDCPTFDFKTGCPGHEETA